MSPYYILYSIFNMSSCRQLEIQNDLPKSPKSSEFAIFFNKLWSKILNYVYFIMFNNYSIEF